MTTADTQRCRSSCEPCGPRAFKRNRYFDGKLLVTADFADEQSYLRGKDRLHASGLHGAGTVCGLKLRQHENPACRNRYVTLEPGLALDCCGHEIIVDREVQIDLRAAIEHALQRRNLLPLDEAGRDVFVHLAYRECDTDPVPSLGDACGCEDHGTEFGRTQESWELFVDLDAPEAAPHDPLDLGVTWRQTLSVARPEALEVDRHFKRLYLAEWDGDAGALRVFDTDNHRLVRRVRLVEEDEAPRRPTALAPSLRGDLVYVAEAPVPGAGARLAVFARTALEATGTGTRQASFAVGGARRPIIGLHVNGRDDSLLALLDDGRILRWTGEQLLAGTGTPQTLTLEGAEPAAMAVTTDGRWAVVADRAGPGLVVVNLAQFQTATVDVPGMFAGTPDPAAANLVAVFRVPHAGLNPAPVPDAVAFPFDGEFLYVISRATQHLYRIDVGTTLEAYVPLADDTGRYVALPLVADPAAEDAPIPVDVSVSLRDSWAFVLRRLTREEVPLNRGEVAAVPLDRLKELQGVIPGALTAELVREASPTEGVARFQRLAFLGARLYVAGSRPRPTDGDEEPPEETEGSVSVLEVDEAQCGSFFRHAVDGCAECAKPASVVIGSVARYRWDLDLVDAGPGLGDVNQIDNYAHRAIVPSTATLKQVIECMLAKGITEGVPGPRGEAGATGPRGPGIVDVTASAATAAAARLVPVPGDPEGNLRLELDLPRGPQGPRGAGIVDVDLRLLPPGQAARATLEPLDGDFRLVLELPQAGPPPVRFNRVVNASWHHDELLGAGGGLADVIADVGFAVAFDRPALGHTLHERSVFALVRRRDDDGAFVCDCVWPLEVEPLRDLEVEPRDVRWLVGTDPTDEVFELVRAAEPTDEGSQEPAAGVRLVLPEELRDPETLRRFLLERRVEQVTVVLRGDWILDEDEQALDGNHLWPGVPGRPSGNQAQGDDWRSVLHVRFDQ